jgi:hypothetical protein
MKIDAHGAVGESDARGDFWTGHTLDEAKHEGLTIGLGEGADGLEDGVGLGARMGSGRERGRRLPGSFGGGGLFDELLVRFCAAVKIRGAVSSDRSEPPGKFGDFAQGIETWQSLKEDVLNEVVDVRIRHAREKNAVNHASVTGVQEAEGGAVALPSGAHQHVVGAAVFEGSVHGRETGVGRTKFKQCRHVGSIEIKDRLPRQTRGDRRVLTILSNDFVCSRVGGASGLPRRDAKPGKKSAWAFHRKSPSFAKVAKDGAPSSSFGKRRNKWQHPGKTFADLIK